jgi:hypothetical protein
MPKLNGARSKRSRSRKRQFGETKPNFGLEVRKEWEDFLKTEGPRIKEEDPEFYYHLIGKKLPKKYQDPFRGTKPTPAEIIPVKVKTDEEIKREKEKADQEKQIKKAKDDKFIKQQQVDMKEKQRKEYNRVTFEKQQKLVHWCNAHEQGNYRNIHSEEYKRKTEKEYKYY